MKKLLVMIGFTGLFWATSLHAALEVINVTWRQRLPYDLVDIDYEVVADDPDADVWVYPQVRTGERDIIPRVLTGDGAATPVKPGKHRITWDTNTEDINFDPVTFSVTFFAIQDAPPYIVIDLSGGTAAERYPISWLTRPPTGGWTDEYKGNKLVLRFIPPGTFMMGSPSGELGGYPHEPFHQVTLTQPFYMGIFQVTQKQWRQVMGNEPSRYKGDFRPVERVSYTMIRGSDNGVQWPVSDQVDADSFLGVLQSKTGITIDLPTEAQWEYACRAKTLTAFNSGQDITATESCPNMAEVGRYNGNTDDGKGGYSEHTTVGLYLPNGWELYDMHGNVCEWCLDWWGKPETATVTDPKGAIPNEHTTVRVIRGGYSRERAERCRSGSRINCFPSGQDYSIGFRVCAPLPSNR